MLGLRNATVTLAPYTPAWADAYVAALEELRTALITFPCLIEHIGSTAVPGLSAKPILDIGVAMTTDISFVPIFQAIELLDFRHRGDAGSQGGHVFVRESSPMIRTHHLHLVRHDDPQWERYLLFRDHLRKHSDDRKAYDDAKRALASQYADDRKAYSAAKDQVVGQILEHAQRSTS